MISRCKLCNEVVEPDDLLDALDFYSRSRHLRLVHHWDYVDNRSVSGTSKMNKPTTFFVVSILAPLSITNAYAQSGSGQYITQILNIISVLERMID